MSVRFDIDVYLALGADITADPSTWSWNTDITSYCYVREGGIRITRGRQNEQSQSQPSSCTLLLNNGDGRFSRLNPLGAYYGQLTKNTPIRVRANPGGGLVTRFVGFVSEWPVRWDKSGNDFWVPIRADGVLRRLGQGDVARSFLYRRTRGNATTSELTGYWPLEDATGSTQAASGLDGGLPLKAINTVSFGSVTPPAAASDSLPDFTNGAMLAGPAQVTATTGWLVQFTLITESAAGSSDAIPVAWYCVGSLAQWYVKVTSTAVQLFYVSGGTATAAGSATIGLYDGGAHLITVTAYQSSSDIITTITVGDSEATGGSVVSTTTIGAIKSVSVNPLQQTDSGWTTVGHLVTGLNVNQGPYSQTDVDGYAGEQTTGERFAAIADLESVYYDVATGSTEYMGSYTVDTLLGTLRECEAAEAGLIVERRTGELGFDPHAVRENVSASLTLDYSASHLDDITPEDDDQLTRNDWTVTRLNGSSYRVVENSGPLSVDPTTGAGRYASSATLNLYEDEQAYHHAGWRVRIGTVNEYRFPRLALKLHNSNLSALVDTIAAVDVSDRITIQNLPSNLPPDDVELMVEGYTETINNFEWSIVFNCSPYSPYQVGILAEASGDTDSLLGRVAESAKAALRTAIDSDDLSMAVDPNFYRWTTEADDFDPDLQVRLGGEVVDVSGISTTAGTYVAVGAASHADNAAVTPALYAGGAANDLILVFAAIRSSGTGTLATPTGYTRLPVWDEGDHIQLFGKVHDGSESDPTITPSGGSAGDTVSAFTFGLRNTPCSLTDLADVVVDAATVYTASSVTIPYPGLYPRRFQGCIVLGLGWKQNDYGTITPPSGFTEILEASTTTGSNQSLYAAYQIQTTPAVVNEGAFSGSGAASVPTRGAMVAIASGYQTFTISARSVNGAVKSHAAGTTVETEHPLVLSL